MHTVTKYDSIRQLTTVIRIRELQQVKILPNHQVKLPLTGCYDTKT